MGRIVPQQRLASAAAVLCGRYGEVSRCAQERGVCRQWIYREAAWVLMTLQGTGWQQQRSQSGERACRAISRPVACCVGPIPLSCYFAGLAHRPCRE